MEKKAKQTYQFLLRLNEGGGIDVHKQTFKVAACHENEVPQERTFGTFTKDIYAMRDFLVEQKIKHVVAESTGVYWKPMYRILTAAGIEVSIVNPARVKQMPMEKTDKKDARWLAKLLMNDMIKKSFVPDDQQEQLREFSRMRTKYIRQMSRVKNQIVRLLESCNFKIRSIVSDISTKTAQKLINAISNGQTDPALLIALCHHSVRKRQGDERLKLAMDGRFTNYMQQQLCMLLNDLYYFEKQKKQTDNVLEELFTSEQIEKIKKLDEVDGVSKEQAEIIMAEIGAGIDSFGEADQGAKYAGLTAGQRETADQPKPVRAVPGNKHLRVVMVQIAWSAVKVKNGYWKAEYQYLKKRIGAKKAILAIARKIFKAIYKVLTTAHRYEQWDAKKFYDNRIKTIEFKKRLSMVV